MHSSVRAIVAAATVALFMLVTVGSASAGAPVRGINERRTTDTSTWNPPSPDPMGLAWDPRARRLMVVDSEVEETPLFRNANGFKMRRNGRLAGTFDLTSFTDEPTDIVRHPRNGRYFVSSDNPDRVYEIFPGPDRRPFTGDDRIREMSTRGGPFANMAAVDVEGLAFGANSLWLANEKTDEIFRVRPGNDHRFTGRFENDNRVNKFDVSQFGQTAPEGVEWNTKTKTLLVVSKSRGSNITELTKRGNLVAHYDGSVINWRSPSGLRFAPSSGPGRGRSLYVTDRGVDNDQQPNENDGMIYEVRLSRNTV